MAASFSFTQIPTVSPLHQNPKKTDKTHEKSPRNTDSEDHVTHLLYNFKAPFELKQVHSHIIKNNLSPTILPLNKVGHICSLSTPVSLSNNFDYARKIFESVDKPEIIIWNSILKDLATGDNPREAILLFTKLRFHDILPDTFGCSFVLKACSLLLSLYTGKIIHGFVLKSGFGPDIFVQNTLIHMYACCGVMGASNQIFHKMDQRDVITYNTMITHNFKIGDCVAGRHLFDEMGERNVTSWTAMIAGYTQLGKPEEAINMFHEMEKAKVRPNEVTVVSVLSACADMGALDLGRKLHLYIKRRGICSNIRVCNTLIDMYVKCGCLDKAREVFYEMQKRTVVSWSTMIMGLAVHGHGLEAFKLFDKMKEENVRPNRVTFVGILHACSHMGLVEEGLRLFDSMVRDHGLEAEIEHYGCMVDLFSRSGLLKEAREFIDTMPIEPSGAIWGALLGGCRVHKNVEMGEEVIKHLLELEPQNDGYYVVLSNIYAAADRWEDAARVRRLMKERGIRKTPGCSSIVVDGIVHEFLAGDGSHPQAKEIYERWEQLAQELKLEGYVPDTSLVLLDMEEEEKEHSLYRHSEKLAVVFGLMNAPPGKPIRIMKNLRVCRDCHVALKLVSRVSGRQIVLRDRNRFHCFMDGECSCRDYW
ncbi:hypothetical protein AMTRI_Chr10g7610 [Amborella trichopoda]